MKIRYTNEDGVQTYAVIQERNINQEGKTFEATYKGCEIYITRDHGHGKPKDKDLKRFDIVVNEKGGSYAVNTWEDLPNLRSAVKYALIGAILIKTNKGSSSEEIYNDN